MEELKLSNNKNARFVVIALLIMAVVVYLISDSIFSEVENQTDNISEILGRWVDESAVINNEITNGEAPSIVLSEDETFRIMPYAASGGILKGTYSLAGNLLTLNAEEFITGEGGSTADDRTLTLTINNERNKITADENFAFFLSPYYFFLSETTFIISPSRNYLMD